MEYSVFKPIDIISSIRVIKDKNKNDMAFITMTDDTGEIDVTVFSSSYENYQGDILINKTLVIEVKTEMYDNKTKGILNKDS
ncbi:hypothetical protein FQA39_LY12851 [Lamprigera yunnana]|nr:hypothetical protein FQA39_LY12851 [Lamprigera yunnana]